MDSGQSVRQASGRRRLWAGVLVLACSAVAVIAITTRSRQRQFDDSSLSVSHQTSAEPELVSQSLSSPIRVPQVRPDPQEPEDHGTVIRTVDVEGLPVANAELLIADIRVPEPQFSRLGKTSRDGVHRSSSSLEVPLWIAAKAQGYFVQDVLIEEEILSEVKITLRPAGSIRGTVVREESGDPIGPGATVIAWPSQARIPPRDLAKRALAGDPLCAMATTDAQGVFLIDGLESRTPYTLVAGTRGYAMPSPVANLMPESEPVVLRVGRLYGVRVRLVDRTNNAHTLPPNRLPSARDPMDTHVPRATYIPQPSYTSLLAGIAEITPYRTAAQAEYLFVAPEALASVGPLDYSVTYFGYSPIKETLWAYPVEDKIEDALVEVVPVGGARGSVQVGFFGIAPGLEGMLHRQGGVGEVVLIAASGERLAYGIPSFQGESCVLTDIPFGEYGVYFVSYLSSFKYPQPEPQPLTIDGTPAEFLVDLTATGALELVPYRPDQTRYYGTLSSYIMTGDMRNDVEEHRGGPAIFERPPFIVSGLHPGRYSVVVMNPAALEEESIGVIEIRSGQTARVNFKLAD